MRAPRPRFAPSEESHEPLLTGFLSARFSGDLDEFKRLLTDDVTQGSDRGSKVRSAATRPEHGADSVARLYIGLEGIVAEICDVDV